MRCIPKNPRKEVGICIGCLCSHTAVAAGGLAVATVVGRREVVLEVETVVECLVVGGVAVGVVPVETAFSAEGLDVDWVDRRVEMEALEVVEAVAVVAVEKAPGGACSFPHRETARTPEN